MFTTVEHLSSPMGLSPSRAIFVATDQLAVDQSRPHDAAILDLITRLMSFQNAESVRAHAASLIAEHLGADYVAIGENAIRNIPCPLATIAGNNVPPEDWRADIEAALGECAVTTRAHATPVPHLPPAPHMRQRRAANPSPSMELSTGIALRHLANRSVQPMSLLTVPLMTNDDRCGGAILVAWSNSATGYAASRTHHAFMFQAAAPMAELFFTVDRSTPSALMRKWKTIKESFDANARRSWVTMAAVVILISLLPYRYPVSAEVSVQPNVRRWIVAPFDAPLEKVHVIPGQAVAVGDLLFTIDCEDTRNKLASLQAESKRSIAERSTHLTSARLSDAAIAGWHIKQIASEIDRLTKHLDRAEIRSPIDGVVLGDDLQRLEGTPLKAGQSLLEVAQIDDLHIDLDVPTDQILRVSLGSKVSAKIEAAGSVDELSLTRLHPRAEANEEGVYVFRGRAELTDGRAELKPGMRGRATIHGEFRPLVWCIWQGLWQRLRDWS